LKDNSMKAMVIERIKDTADEKSLKPVDRPIPEPADDQVLLKVSACGVCRTDIDEIEGRTAPSYFPVVPGHQVVGRIIKCGRSVKNFKTGERVGVGWIFKSCGKCRYCVDGYENLCDEFIATGRDADGGYAEYIIAYQDYAYHIPEFLTDIEAAPLLCAGSIGWRSLRLTKFENRNTIGLYGFGASGHIVIQIIRSLYPESKVFVFTRSKEEQKLALKLGASWTGEITDRTPEVFDVAIDTTPAWLPVIYALENLKKGGRLVINAIRKEPHDRENLMRLQYEKHLWLEKEIKSVANVTRRDIAEFLELSSQILVKPEITTYPFEEANTAILDIKYSRNPGAKVLVF